MSLFKNSKFPIAKKKVEEVTDDNFHLYFFDASKHEKKPDQVKVRFRQHMSLESSPLKEEIIRYLAEIEGGVINAIRMLMDHAACSKEQAIKLCHEMIAFMYNSKRNHIDISSVIKAPFRYTVDMYYYTKPEHVPKDSRWTIVE